MTLLEKLIQDKINSNRNRMGRMLSAPSYNPKEFDRILQETKALAVLLKPAETTLDLDPSHQN